MKHNLASASLLFLVFQSSVRATPQASDIPTVETLLTQMMANADHYRSTLPSLIADESISSQVSVAGPIKQKAEARATMRVLRELPDGSLKESRQITWLNGKSIAPGQKASLPLLLTGAFGGFEDLFFTKQHRSCFDFRLQPSTAPGGPLQLSFSEHSGAEQDAGCRETSYGVTGFALLDPATKQIVHLERTLSNAVPTNGGRASFAAIDLAPALIGDQIFWLPTQIVGRYGHGRGEFTAHYSNYHRFTGTFTLLPATNDVPPSS